MLNPNFAKMIPIAGKRTGNGILLLVLRAGETYCRRLSLVTQNRATFSIANSRPITHFRYGFAHASMEAGSFITRIAAINALTARKYRPAPSESNICSNHVLTFGATN